MVSYHNHVELEDKTKGMLKLIEGDADTFAQRAEMYYKKRPELINMIEDFYRSYRSLAESYDQLKLESGNPLLNRRFSLTSRSFTNESLASSLVTSYSHSDSEVDDPAEEVESKLKKTQVECMLEKSTEKNSEVCVVKPMVEEIRSKKNIFIEEYAKAASKMLINGKKEVHSHPVARLMHSAPAHGDIELARLMHSEFDYKLSSVL